ncbi:hypothetical protein BDD14_5787 [Edaphobacter modestus]|uniref:Uncharacterized protein n=1 Tax=Edaphobacter modestus TaxID=388466 RepID=A0A4Q7YH28_9BACT|nr:hypothetical protein BDD14_5787 [Edaphobacter modestus]
MVRGDRRKPQQPKPYSAPRVASLNNPTIRLSDDTHWRHEQPFLRTINSDYMKLSKADF